MVTLNSDRAATLIFGAYELDLQAGVLRKDGIRLRCQEQPRQVLAVLAERPGELVTREELRRRVWPQDTFVDFDHALNTAVKKIRATLNDDADAPRYIETVPRRGYRFVAPVERVGVSVPALSPLQPDPPQDNNRRPLTVLGVAAAILAMAVGLAWRLAPWRSTQASTPPEFRRLTFDQPTPELTDARFTPDGASVVYTVGGHSSNGDIHSQRLGAASSQSLGIPNATLLGVSRQGELAVLIERTTPLLEMDYRIKPGTLARVPLGGGAPRELVPDVEAADWSPDGQIAVVRRVGRKCRLEFPVGHVLYENTGWIASPRFSPSGDTIGFLDHPVAPDDRGTVVVVGLSGSKKVLTDFWESERGLAWTPGGDELWFAAAHSGVSRAIYAVNLSGRTRTILNVAGGLSLEDISRDGRVLLSRDNERLGILFMGAGEKEPRELSWKDWSIAMDISPDGKQILFGDEGEDSGFSYQVGLRPTDGSPPVMLGSGAAQSLSPDGKWALSIMPPPNDQMVLLPTGAGTPKALERGAVEHYQFTGAKWFPDAKRIVFVGSEPDHGQRCYVQSIEAGKPRAFTADGVGFCSVSPNGQILAISEDRRVMLYPSDSSNKPYKELALQPGELPSGWSSDGNFLYLSQTREKPMSISRLELASGHRQLWKQLPSPPDGSVMKSECILISRDGQSYAYTYSHHLSDLYVVQGLK